MNTARLERLALCELAGRLGPDAPTRCAGWDVADLAAHLVVRERRPDAAAGLVVPWLAAYGERVRRDVRARTPFPRLIELIRQGPPRWSPWALPGVDEASNLVEFFVHHEDLRRAQPGWSVRSLDPAVEEALWRRLSLARLVLRRLPVGVAVQRPDGAARVLKGGLPQVVVAGPASELTLWALGRRSVARVELHGDPATLSRLAAATWRL